MVARDYFLGRLSEGLGRLLFGHSWLLYLTARCCCFESTSRGRVRLRICRRKGRLSLRGGFRTVPLTVTGLQILNHGSFTLFRSENFWLKLPKITKQSHSFTLDKWFDGSLERLRMEGRVCVSESRDFSRRAATSGRKR